LRRRRFTARKQRKTNKSPGSPLCDELAELRRLFNLAVLADDQETAAAHQSEYYRVEVADDNYNYPLMTIKNAH
jgi:hypothetical protein